MKDKSENNNLIYLILIVFIAFVFIIIGEIFFVKNVKKGKDNKSNFTYKTNDKYYDTSKLDVIDIDLKDTYHIGSTCNSNKCTYKYSNYYFIYTKDNNTYDLTIVDGNRLLKELNIGESINSTYIFKYQDNIAISNIKINDSFKTDYVVLINEDNKIDVYESLEANEIEYEEDGIIYYYSKCVKDKDYNAYKVKAKRKPFTNNIKELNVEEKNYQWC
jgi:hypothetical protein